MPARSVAPGPVWPPLIPAAFDADRVSSFVSQVPMGRAPNQDEIAPSYVVFASERMSSYSSREVLASPHRRRNPPPVTAYACRGSAGGRNSAAAIRPRTSPADIFLTRWLVFWE